jgi:hypothetical protein
MKFKLILATALALIGLWPCLAIASTFILDTGTPPPGQTPIPILNSSDWYAAEFSATGGETITQLAAYLTQGAGEPGDTFTFDIFSPSGFLGGRNLVPLYSATATYTANGWNSVAANWTVTTTGDYWVALEVSNSTQTRGLDLPTEASDTSGTVPALAFAVATTNHQFQLETNSPFGIEVSATPIPAALPLFAGGLGMVGWLAHRRKREGPQALAA